MDEIKPAPESTINQHENATNSSEEHIALKNDTFEIHDSALGNDLPKGYYYNWRFIGVVIVRRASFSRLSCSRTLIGKRHFQ